MIPEAMLNRVMERRERWATEYYQELPHAWELKEAVISGDYSICGLESRRRFLLSPRCIVIQEAEPILETPPSLARDYLYTLWPSGPNIFRKQWTYLYKHLGLEKNYGRWEFVEPLSPLLALPGKFAEGYYVDIKATYFSVMLRTGWDVDYWPKKWIGRGRTVEDFPFPREKVARNCLVSACHFSTLSVYTPTHGTIQKPSYNHHLNYQLICLISDTLHGLAHEAERLGAKYVNCDGYIFTHWREASHMMGIIRDWGLTPRLRAEGKGATVRGPGDYAVGRLHSRRGLDRPIPARSIKEIEYRDWLRDRMAKLTSLMTVNEEDLC